MQALLNRVLGIYNCCLLLAASAADPQHNEGFAGKWKPLSFPPLTHGIIYQYQSSTTSDITPQKGFLH